MRVSLTPCFVLHQRAYRETSLLLEVFSREYGRLGLVARGVKRNRKKSQSLIQLYRKLNISWSGRGEMPTLTEVETIGPGLQLQGEAVISAFYLNELLMRLLHRHESHPELFDAYLAALGRLQSGQARPGALRYFEKHLLDSLGYGLVLDHDVESGKPIDPEKRYYYLINRGPCLQKPVNASMVEITGNTLLALDSGEFDGCASLAEVRQLMRLTLNGYLGQKPLASRDLYRAYIEQRNRSAAV